MTVAGRALKANIVALGLVVLPWSEQLRFAANLIGRKVSSTLSPKPQTLNLKP